MEKTGLLRKIRDMREELKSQKVSLNTDCSAVLMAALIIVPSTSQLGNPAQY